MLDVEKIQCEQGVAFQKLNNMKRALVLAKPTFDKPDQAIEFYKALLELELNLRFQQSLVKGGN